MVNTLVVKLLLRGDAL